MIQNSVHFHTKSSSNLYIHQTLEKYNQYITSYTNLVLLPLPAVAIAFVAVAIAFVAVAIAFVAVVIAFVAVAIASVAVAIAFVVSIYFQLAAVNLHYIFFLLYMYNMALLQMQTFCLWRSVANATVNRVAAALPHLALWYISLYLIKKNAKSKRPV